MINFDGRHREVECQKGVSIHFFTVKSSVPTKVHDWLNYLNIGFFVWLECLKWKRNLSTIGVKMFFLLAYSRQKDPKYWKCIT